MLSVGCNASFYTLILKVSNFISVRDFRPISLIGLQYNVIAKILALRLAKVVGILVNCKESTFVKGRQSIDIRLMVIELVDFCKKKEAKTYDI